jgi:hypothetical protein
MEIKDLIVTRSLTNHYRFNMIFDERVIPCDPTGVLEIVKRLDIQRFKIVYESITYQYNMILGKISSEMVTDTGLKYPGLELDIASVTDMVYRSLNDFVHFDGKRIYVQYSE